MCFPCRMWKLVANTDISDVLKLACPKNHVWVCEKADFKLSWKCFSISLLSTFIFVSVL